MSNELNPNPLRDMDPVVREALGNKTRQLFSVLKAHYTQYHFVIKDDKQEAAMLQHWAKALLVGKVSEEMLRKGLEKAKANSIENSFYKWPNLSNFIAWCHGIPSPESAYFETAKNCHDLTEWEPTHPIVGLAGSHTGFYDIRNSDNQKYYKAEYIRFYCELLVRVMGGEELTYTKLEKPIQISKKEPTEEDIKRNREMISELFAEIKDEEEEEKELESEAKTKKIAEMKERIEAWEKSRGEK